jgi:hypothetical protein
VYIDASFYLLVGGLGARAKDPHLRLHRVWNAVDLIFDRVHHAKRDRVVHVLVFLRQDSKGWLRPLAIRARRTERR